MTTRRIVDIAVPNASNRAVVATIRIRPAEAATLEQAGLKIASTGITVHGYGLVLDDVCAKPRPEDLPQEIRVELAPYDARLIRAIIDTEDPDKENGAVAFDVQDEREGMVVGGVTIVCTSPRYPNDLAAAAPRDTSPIVLARSPFVIPAGADPTGGTSTLGSPGTHELVATVVNPTNRALRGVVVYLEHTGGAGIRFVPRTWTIGELESQGHFPATWEVDARDGSPGDHETSFVVRDADHEPTRVRGVIRVAARDGVGSAASTTSG